MFPVIAILCAVCAVGSQAEKPITAYGKCPNVVPVLNASVDTYIGSIWYEVMRSNDGEGRNEWCSNVYVSRINDSALMWDDVRYNALTSTVIENPLIITGCNGTFAINEIDTGYSYLCKILLANCDLIVCYVCQNIGDYMRIDKVYVYSTLMHLTCEMKELVDGVLQRYGIDNTLVATVQGIPECSQLRGPSCQINVVNS